MNSIPLKLLLREIKSKHLMLLIVSILIALTSLLTVQFLNERIQQVVQLQTKSMTGGDLVLISDIKFDRQFSQQAEQLGLKTTSTLRFVSMLFSGEKSQLTEIKAISDRYPLYGQLKGSESQFSKNSVWIDEKLAEKLNLKIGSSLELGNISVKVTGFIEQIPEQVVDLSQLLPKVIIHESIVQKTGLIGLGSRISYRLMIAGDSTQVQSYKAKIANQLHVGQRIEDSSQLRNEVQSIVKKVNVFLQTISLLSIFFAFIASTFSLQSYLKHNRKKIALFKCLGLTRIQIFKLYLKIFILLGLVLSVTSFALSVIIQDIMSRIMSELGSQSAIQNIITAIPSHVLSTFSIILIVGLPFIAYLVQIPVLNIFRSTQDSYPTDAKRLILLSYGVSFLLFIGFFAYTTRQNTELNVMTSLAMLVIFGILYSLFKLLIQIVYRYRNRFPRFNRLSIAHLNFNKMTYSLQLSSLTMGVSILLILFFIRNDLIQSWQEQLPANTPNHFMINIQDEQVPILKAYFKQEKLGEIQFYPIIKGRLVAINNKPIAIDSYEDARTRRLLEREYNLSYASNPLINRFSKTVEGNIWNANSQEPQISIEKSLAERFKVSLNDTLTYQVETSYVKAKIVHIRQVEWNSFQPNFFVLLNPVIQYLPKNYMTSVYIAPNDIPKLNKINRVYKNISILDMRSILEQVQYFIKIITYLIQGLFIFVLLSGIMILLASMQQIRSERQKEFSLLHKLGLTRIQILQRYLGEFIVLSILLLIVSFGIATLTKLYFIKLF